MCGNYKTDQDILWWAQITINGNQMIAWQEQIRFKTCDPLISGFYISCLFILRIWISALSRIRPFFYLFSVSIFLRVRTDCSCFEDPNASSLITVLKISDNFNKWIINNTILSSLISDKKINKNESINYCPNLICRPLSTLILDINWCYPVIYTGVIISAKCLY